MIVMTASLVTTRICPKFTVALMLQNYIREVHDSNIHIAVSRLRCFVILRSLSRWIPGYYFQTAHDLFRQYLMYLIFWPSFHIIRCCIIFLV